MRIQRLDLLRYGRFTDVSLPFPQASCDLHLVFGLNEAGKSTSLSAIEDLLFGIPHNSPYNFVHDYSSLRLGGVLEHAGHTLEIRRRKGGKGTLLGADEIPLPAGDAALAPFLAGSDRTFLTRMFSLNNERLAEGGREILDARDEVGQTLFSAGAGLSGLRERLALLDTQADELWAPRKAGHRKYYAAQQRLEEADRALREHTVTAAKWHEAERAFESADQACKTLEQQIEAAAAEQRKLARIRRVYRLMARWAEVDAELATLVEVPLLPGDAATRLTTASDQLATAQSKLDELQGQLAGIQLQRHELILDEAILRRVEEVGQLHNQRIEVQKERADLPRRQAELLVKQEQLRALARQLGWHDNDCAAIAARIPARAKVSAIRALLARRGELLAAIEGARTAFEEHQEQVQELEQALAQAEVARDVSLLAAQIRTAQEEADIGGRIQAADRERSETEAQLQKRLGPLRPAVANAQVLTTMVVPPAAAVQRHRDALRTLERSAEACRDRVRAAQSRHAQHRRAYEQLTVHQQVVAPESLEQARRDRDAGWSLIRRRYVEGIEVAESDIALFRADAPDLSTAYQSRVEAADALADRRFDKAEAAGQLAVIGRQMADAQAEIEELRAEERGIDEERRGLATQWQQLWSEAPFEPLDPDLMVQWLAEREGILGLIDKHDAAVGRLATLRQDEQQQRAALIAELAALGGPTASMEERRLRVVLEAATAACQHHQKLAEDRRTTDERLRKARAETTRKRARLDTVTASWDAWEGEWSTALQVLDVPAGTSPLAVTDQLDAIEEMRGIASEIGQLTRERIAKIERDIEAFRLAVEALVTGLAPDLVGKPPEEAALQLERRLDEARRVRDQQAEKDRQIGALTSRIGEFNQSSGGARSQIQRLQQLAAVDDAEQLREVIRRSERRQELAAEKAGLQKTLVAEGDGLPLAALREECTAADLDQVAAREETLRSELKDLHDRLTPAAELRAQARQTFEAIGGDGRAAEAAAARQEALASMRDVAEQYVRARTAATLLRWAIDRYRQQKQAPLLRAAGSLFATLTLDAFTDLRVHYDDQDRAGLVGIRSDQSAVGIDGMSEGTRDQLYLALRLASVDEYLGRAHPLPFVADDLLVQFDDLRAAAGFRALAQLAQRTQVLFFTHHRHLIEVARSALGQALNVTDLTEAKVASAA